MKRAILFFIILFTAFNSHAQDRPYYRVDTIPVYQYGRPLLFPWVGGLNSPQFSAVTLDQLGVSLLVIFDRCGEHFYTFLNQGIKDSTSYLYAPQYELNFPVCHNFALLRDYNCDGIPDIFSSTYDGIDVYRGFYNSNNQLDFTLASPLLEYPYISSQGPALSNVFVSGSDLPAIDDVNGDGSMDILSFGVTGGFIYDYKNVSKDSGYGCDSLKYVLQQTCWLNIFDNYWLTVDTNVCGTNAPRSDDTGSSRSRHAGNTLCTFDEDSSENKSALWGGITFPYSVFFHNGGPNDTSVAYSDWQDTTFPKYNIPDSMRSFPAAYSLDLNNDGYSDLLFAPNYTFGTEDYDNVRYYQQVPSLYDKTGTKYKQYYQYKGDSLFSKDMIDVGSGSSPTFFHYFNNDTSSIYDLIIGSIGTYNINANPNGCLALYQNIGTKGHPVFQLVSKDFASITNFGLNSVVPTFGDLRDTGSEDMILGTGPSVNNPDSHLYYFKNTAGVGSPAQYKLESSFFDSISIPGGYTAPQLVDVDGDGLLDLLVGCYDGIIYYYHNDGTKTSPKFTLVSSNFGDVYVANEGYEYGESDPFLYRDSTGKLVLLVGSLNGSIFRYDSIMNSNNEINDTFALTDSSFANINTGYLSQSKISGVNFFGDNGMDLAIGNYRGGVSIFSNSLGGPTGIKQVEKPFTNCNLYPNPANDEITISLSGVPDHNKIIVDVEDELGRTLLSNTAEIYQFKASISVSQLPAGLYFCRINLGDTFVVRKFVVSR